jgi:ribonuclease HI
MELTAVVEGLRSLKRRTRVHIVTDSAYVKNGMESWMKGWKARNWMRKTADGLKPVKNVEIWRKLDELLQKHDASFEHVRGHSGHPENERCDELAVAAYKKLLRKPGAAPENSEV